VLRPISYTSQEPIFLFTNISKVGAGTWVRQGPTPETTILAFCYSLKFATTQLYNPLYKLKLLTMVDVVEIFQPILYSPTFITVTNNKFLSYFMKQTTMGKGLTR
jgi:hypothetical protein